MADNSDRISTLPDSLLCHILSFLPTKQAVSTSVLSKRWKPLYLSLPALDFDDQNHIQNKDTYVGFVLFVYAVMLSRDVNQTINRFRLKCVSSSLCEPPNVNKWVNFAMQRGVQHLDLSLPSSVNLPSSVLGSRTLVVVKLSGLTVNAVSSVGFPSLRILHLKRVHFPKRRYLAELLSGCPVLEDLLIKSLHIHSFLSVAEFKGLPNLVRADLLSTIIPLIAIYNVEFLRIKVSLSYFLNVIPSLNNLTHLEIVSLPCYCDWLVEVLNHCPKLEILLIDKKEMNRNDSENWAYPQSVPECLSSRLRTCSLIKYGGHEVELQFARYVMQNARVLRNMKICSTSTSNSQEKLEMIKKLSMCPRSSATCELSFE